MTKTLAMTVSLAITWLSIGVVVWAGVWFVQRGRSQRDRHSVRRGIVLLTIPTSLLFLITLPQLAYLWTETLWYEQFARNGVSAGYASVFWRIIRTHWAIFFTYTSLGFAFLMLNVMIARRVCPLDADFQHWASARTRLTHRLFALLSLVTAGLMASALMWQWQVVKHARAYDEGHGRIEAVVRHPEASGGSPTHPYLPAPWEPAFHGDIDLLHGLLSNELATEVQSLSLVRFYEEKAGDGHVPENPHYTIRGFLAPEEDGYRVSLELSGPTVLERVAEDASISERERLRRRRTGENYSKSQVFSVVAGKDELPFAAKTLVDELTQSKYLRNGFADPIFHKNVGYYLFKYPRLEWLTLWVKVLLWVSIGIIALQYRFYYHRDSHSMLSALTGVAVHTSALWILLLAAGIWRSLVAREGLLYAKPNIIKSGRIPFGVSYIDLVQIGAYVAYMAVLGVLIVVLIVNLFGRSRKVWYGVAVAWAAAYVLVLWAYPAVVYVVKVRPNPFRVERVFLANHIAMTRHSFNLDAIRQENVIRTLATFDDVASHPEVLKNVQVWDRRVLWERLQQSQTIQQYYEFYPYPDVDRYEINGEQRQVLLAAREINPNKLRTREWFTKRLKYTHGYGAVLAPVNEVEDPGVPRLWVKGIPMQTPSEPGYGDLRITRPEIYYGEVTNEYVLVKTEEQEIDFPLEGVFQLTQYEGRGGVVLGGGLRRLAFASRLDEPLRIALSSLLNPDTRVMMHRNILKRAKRIAPFMRFDPDPYLVIGKDTGKLWWMIDLYTVSRRYPYAQIHRALDANGDPIDNLGGDPHDEPDFEKFNYIRNSAVAVVDPYDGDVRFFVTNPDDPLIKMYVHDFPELFQPMSQMPDELRTHLRYPDYLQWVQASMYALYHVEDPVVFITGGDAWKLPRELFHTNTLQPMMPYYTVLKLPDSERSEFVSVLPFAPPATTKRLTAWLVAGSDGDQYGTLRCYTLSRAEEVDGPEQIENRIDQDTELSGQFTLLGQAGSEVIRGNLLLLPVETKSGENALFYAEPVYLRATGEEGQSMPELKFVIVVADDKLASDTTFQAALRKVFRVGQFSIVQGTITDDHSAPIQDAVITLLSESGAPFASPATTAPDGSYRLENVPPGVYKARVAREGFKTVQVDVTVPEGQPASLSQSMTPSATVSTSSRTLAQIAASANSSLNRYLRLTGEGKLLEAAQSLQQLKEDLQALSAFIEANAPAVSLAP
ncbi:MAG: UPF0182 family protein [Candidatus Poribacteria bacterium]|nr:UPF0182 family protein [Candidatus Poribacteria bacterium]